MYFQIKQDVWEELNFGGDLIWTKGNGKLESDIDGLYSIFEDQWKDSVYGGGGKWDYFKMDGRISLDEIVM